MWREPELEMRSGWEHFAMREKMIPLFLARFTDVPRRSR